MKISKTSIKFKLQRNDIVMIPASYAAKGSLALKDPLVYTVDQWLQTLAPRAPGNAIF